MYSFLGSPLFLWFNKIKVEDTLHFNCGKTESYMPDHEGLLAK